MKKVNRRKLNNKGFTLIELLAVVVILAVVMGIATSQVLRSINISRQSSLQSSAASAASAFEKKYAESLLVNEQAKVFGIYNFSTASTTAPVAYYISTDGKNSQTLLNLSSNRYQLNEAAEGTAATAVNDDDKKALKNSVVIYDGVKFIVCLQAKSTGDYYVSNAISKVAVTTKYNINYGYEKDIMFACSDDTTSWQ